jgi:hypothetical protein
MGAIGWIDAPFFGCADHGAPHPQPSVRRTLKEIFSFHPILYGFPLKITDSHPITLQI